MSCLNTSTWKPEYNFYRRINDLSLLSHRVVRLDLPVEQPVLLDAGVAVHRPDQPEVVLAPLVRLGAEHGRGGAAVHLDVAPGRKEGRKEEELKKH